MSIIVSQLFIYPIKSAAGVSVNELSLSGMGPQNDRRFMLVDEQGKFYTQREDSRLCLVRPTISDSVLHISMHDYESFDLMLPIQESSLKTVTVWQDTLVVQDCGDDVANYFSSYFAKKLRLVFMSNNVDRYVDRQFAHSDQTVSFADGFPLLLCSESSLSHFNQYLEQAIPINRFRPNIVISGAEAYAEDQWKQLKIGDLYLDIVKPCSRCVIPSINQLTAEKEKEVSKMLAKYRRKNGHVYFGQNLLFNGHGSINLGQEVQIVG